MARVQLTDPVFRHDAQSRLYVLPDAVVTTFEADGATPSTIYAQRSGGPTVAQPLTTDAEGTIVDPATDLPVFVNAGFHVIRAVSGATTIIRGVELPTGDFDARLTRVEGHYVDPFNFGAVGDGVHDDLPALIAAQQALPGTRGGILELPPGDFFCNGSLPLLREGLILRGAGGSPGGTAGTSDAPTTLSFPDGVDGVVVHYPGTYTPDLTAGADWSTLEHMFIRAKSKVTPGKIGVRVWCRTHIHDVVVSSFSGDGIQIKASTGGTPPSNANNWKVAKARVTNCDGNGMFVDGVDVNAGYAELIELTNNGQWGLRESSFLGNTYVALLTESNGRVDGTSGGIYAEGQDSGSGVNCSRFISCYKEAGQPGNDKIEAPSVVLFPLGNQTNVGNAPTLVQGGTNKAFNQSPTSFDTSSSLGATTFKIGTDSGGNDQFWAATSGPSGHQLRFRFQADAWSYTIDGLDAQRPLQITDAGAPEGSGFLRFRRGYFITGSSTKGATNPAQRYIGNSDAAPVSGTWTRGDILWNTLPSASGKVGWVCTASGTPGTWKAFGVIDA